MRTLVMLSNLQPIACLLMDIQQDKAPETLAGHSAVPLPAFISLFRDSHEEMLLLLWCAAYLQLPWQNTQIAVA